MKRTQTEASQNLLESAENEAAKTLTEAAIKIVKWTGKTFQFQFDVHKAAENYFARYNRRYGQMKILGMAESMPLREIFTSVELVDAESLRAFKTTEQLKRNFRAKGDRSLSQYAKRVDGLTFAGKQQFLNVLGAPGAGKSTFLRRIGLAALESTTAERFDYRIPVFIELKSLRDSQSALLNVVRTELQASGFPAEFADAALRTGDLLLLLDGLDEVHRDRVDDVVAQICHFVDSYEKNRFVTSCRTAFYKTWFARFVDVVLADFDNKQIERFIRNWFKASGSEDDAQGEKLWKLLTHPDNKATLDLARTPLLLTFICLVYRRGQSLPPHRSSLYKRALDILIQEWAAEKRVHSPEIYKGLYPDLEIELLSEIAGPAFEAEDHFFTKDELLRKIASFLGNELNAPAKMDAGEVLRAIEVQQGLLVERAPEVYSFSHLTIQEYLSAKYFLTADRTGRVVENRLTDPAWHEVFLLMAGIEKADPLLTRMSDQLFRIARQNEQIISVLHWSNTAIEPDDNVEVCAARRAAALALAFSSGFGFTSAFGISVDVYWSRSEARRRTAALSAAIADSLLGRTDTAEAVQSIEHTAVRLGASRTPALAAAILMDFDIAWTRHAPKEADVDRIFVRQLASLAGFRSSLIGEARANIDRLKGQFPGEETDKEVRIRFLRSLRSAILSGLGLPAILHDWNYKDDKPLEDYLQGCLHMLHARTAALRLSASTWQRLLGRFLTPPQ